MSNEMHFSSDRVVRGLAIFALFLVVVGFSVQCLKSATGVTTFYGLFILFDLGQEGNLPTYFSSALLLISAVLLTVIAVEEGRKGSDFVGRWKLLAIGFFYLSVDESAHLHELFVRPFRELLGSYANGYLYFAWVVPGVVGVCVLGVMYLKFLAALQPKFRSRFLLAAALYLGGAIGMELIDGKYAVTHGMDLGYQALVAVEEGMEMSGVILFIAALFAYIEMYVGSTTLRFESDRADERVFVRDRQPRRSPLVQPMYPRLVEVLSPRQVTERSRSQEL